MPTAERYSRYRADQTTIWVSKNAADFLSRERQSPGEGASAVLDRVISEYRRNRRATGGGGGGGGAAKSAAKGGATKAGAGTRGTRSAARGAAKGGAKSGRRA